MNYYFELNTDLSDKQVEIGFPIGISLIIDIYNKFYQGYGPYEIQTALGNYASSKNGLTRYLHWVSIFRCFQKAVFRSFQSETFLKYSKCSNWYLLAGEHDGITCLITEVNKGCPLKPKSLKELTSIDCSNELLEKLDFLLMNGQVDETYDFLLSILKNGDFDDFLYSLNEINFSAIENEIYNCLIEGYLNIPKKKIKNLHGIYFQWSNIGDGEGYVAMDSFQFTLQFPFEKFSSNERKISEDISTAFLDRSNSALQITQQLQEIPQKLTNSNVILPVLQSFSTTLFYRYIEKRDIENAWILVNGYAKVFPAIEKILNKDIKYKKSTIEYKNGIKIKQEIANSIVLLNVFSLQDDSKTDASLIENVLHNMQINDPQLAFNLSCWYAIVNSRKKMLETINIALSLGKHKNEFLSDSDFAKYSTDDDFVALLT